MLCCWQTVVEILLTTICCCWYCCCYIIEVVEDLMLVGVVLCWRSLCFVAKKKRIFFSNFNFSIFFYLIRCTSINFGILNSCTILFGATCVFFRWHKMYIHFVGKLYTASINCSLSQKTKIKRYINSVHGSQK